jgi:hypothetical protein
MYEHNMWHVQMRVIKCYALFYRSRVCPPQKKASVKHTNGNEETYRMYPSKARAKAKNHLMIS